MLDYPLGASRGRQEQVGQLLQFVAERTSGRHTTILCGDFNAAPDSDEIRLITGRAAHASGDLVFYDAWETAGDGSPGYTFARDLTYVIICRSGVRSADVPRAGCPTMLITFVSAAGEARPEGRMRRVPSAARGLAVAAVTAPTT
jgi:hypothetical protein